jgi:hypothetical protein
LIGYGILGVFKFDRFSQWLVYAPFYLLLIAWWLYTRSRGSKEQLAGGKNSHLGPSR